MSPSISVILPVRNLQYVLSNRVHRILEVLSDLTTEFEILIMDYGSTDLTAEVASDLATSYPQVRLLDRSAIGEPLATVDDGIQETVGEFIFVHDASMPFSQQTMRRLWDTREENRSTTPRSRNASGVMNRAYAGSSHRVDRGQSLHLTRRGSAPSGSQAAYADQPMAFDCFTRKDLARKPGSAETMSPNLAARLQRFVAG
ncbi:MAG: glycosyltransferase [Pirellulaceae bacterium]|nr:glycosyltransferase [Pirellulaceae bacterium]